MTIGENLRNALATAQLALRQTEIDRLTAENERLREALKEIVDSTESVASEPTRDPAYGDIVRELGTSIGFGALMSAASYEWRNWLKENGYPLGSEFVAGPCRAVLQSDIARARAALEQP